MLADKGILLDGNSGEIMWNFLVDCRKAANKGRAESAKQTDVYAYCMREKRKSILQHRCVVYQLQMAISHNESQTVFV
jgi:hypothetical protein